MASFNASLAAALSATPIPRVKPSQIGGRIRVFESVYVAPSSGTAPAIGDKIIWGKLPVRARILLGIGQLAWTTGTASCTLNLGDNVVAARHLVATAVTTAGFITINPVSTGALLAKTVTGDITTGSNVVLNVKSAGAATVGDLITGTGIPTGTTITAVTGNTLTMSAVATATTASLAISITGANFETSDDSANAGNSFVSANDDCTLISTVAGAQIANSQVFKLVLPYTVD